MLARFRKWLQTWRAWNADHRATWPSASAIDQDGTSQFLRTCDSMLTEQIRGRSLRIVERMEVSEEHPYLSFEVPALDMKVWIYQNQVDFSTLEGKYLQIIEEWDTRVPDEMYQKAAEFVSRRLLLSTEGAA